MKNKRTLIILLAAIVLLAAIYAAVKVFANREEETNKHYVTPLESPHSVVKMRVENEDEYTLILEDGVWMLEDDDAFTVDQQKALKMANGLRSVFADREVKSDAELSEYGLDPAECRITAWDEEGAEYTYCIGDLNEYANLYYLRQEGRETVYLTDSTLPTLFLRQKQDMLEIERLPDIYETEVTEIGLKRGGKLVKREKDGEWDEKLSEVIRSFAGLYFYDCAAYGVEEEELSAYGLDAPVEATLWYVKTETRYTGKVDEDGNEESEKVQVEYDTTLLFGADTGDGHTYVMLKGSDRVYLASVSESHIIMDAEL